MITIKDSDAADVVIQVTGFNGTSQLGADVASNATFKRTLESKHTQATSKSPGRHLLSAKCRRYDATTGKWGEAVVNFTVSVDASGVIVADDVDDLVALIINYFTKDSTAKSDSFSTELTKFVEGISPF